MEAVKPHELPDIQAFFSVQKNVSYGSPTTILDL